MSDKELVIHPFQPIWDEHSEILILGSIPSVTSRKQQFYYAHPQNRFWSMMEILGKCELKTTQQRIDFLHLHHFALWDVLASCQITGSSDASIKDVKVNDLSCVVTNSKIRTIVTTGKTAGYYYKKYSFPSTNIEAMVLPSTSAANASVRLEHLVQAYQVLFE